MTGTVDMTGKVVCSFCGQTFPVREYGPFYHQAKVAEHAGPGESGLCPGSYYAHRIGARPRGEAPAPGRVDRPEPLDWRDIESITALLLWFYDEYIAIDAPRPGDVAWWETLTPAAVEAVRGGGVR